MKDIYAQPLGNPPRPSGIGVVRYAFVDDACRCQSERAINDVGVTRDPSYVRHAPVRIFRMDILNVLGSSSHVSQIAASAMLAALGLSCGAAGVHQKERGLSVHGNGLDFLAAKILQDFVHEIVPTFYDRRRGTILARVTAPDQHFLDL